MNGLDTIISGNHENLITWAVEFLIGLGVLEIIRRLWRIEDKQDKRQEACAGCRLSLEQEINKKTDLDLFRAHSHDKEGRVITGRKE